jgi:TolB protein
LFDLESGRQEVLGNFPNMTFRCASRPTGKRRHGARNNGNSDIYVMDLATCTTGV